MKQFQLSLVFCFAILCSANAQILFQEDFESGDLPDGWGIETFATDGGWITGTPADLSSQYWDIPDNGSQYVIATNDDQCNCNKSQDVLFMPAIDLSGVGVASLAVDIFFGKRDFQGAVEEGRVSVSIDGGSSWTVIKNLEGQMDWYTLKLDLTAYAGESEVLISFSYNDDGQWLYGFALDNVVIEVPNQLDAQLLALNSIPFALENNGVEIGGTVYNNGQATIESLQIDYIINGTDTIKGSIEGLDIQSFESYDFVHPTPWVPTVQDVYDITVEVTSVNGMVDDVAENNALSLEVEVFEAIERPNRVDEFLLTDPVFTVVATASDQLDKPNDLDFFPILAKNELWIVNERVESSGGSTLTIYDAGTDKQSFWHRVDGNAWHFMSLPTGIEFSENLNFGTSPGVQDANHGGGTFTGPTLWDSDPEVYAQPSGGNGSHIDMLHGSPYSMGIAAEKENVFWIFDSWNEEIVRYDFKMDHGPGNDDHSDGEVRRYREIEIARDGEVPSHMVIDDATGWLYAVDNGNDRVIRLDIHSGEVSNSLPLINEPLAEHAQMANVTWEEIISTNLNRPCGIDVIDNRLLVGDYATGEIIIYDIDNDFVELGRLSTGKSGLTGIKIGPDGAIWYTNRLENTVTKMEPGELVSTEIVESLEALTISPNPTRGLLNIDLPELAPGDYLNLELNDLSGRSVMSAARVRGYQTWHIGHLPEGIYMLSIRSDKLNVVKKIVLKR